MNTLVRNLRPALLLFLLLSAITGIAYPLAITAVAGFAFPFAARGSILAVDGRPVGSALIGQPFDAPRYFWSRPSAITPTPYDAEASGGSNLGANNPALLQAVTRRVQALRAADPGNDAPVPVDLITASASGLDPDISIAAARYQAARVARARGMPQSQVEALIDGYARFPWLGVIGEPRVNVLALNLALDGLHAVPVTR